MYIVFTFDDGRIDAYDAATILKQHNLVGTFFVTTGFIDGSFETDAFGIGRSPLTIEKLKQMKTNGMEIASHGDKHITNSKDFYNSFCKLANWGLLDGKKVGFSIPNSKYSNEMIDNFIMENENFLDYIRVGRNPSCYSFLSKIQYASYNIFKKQVFYDSFNKHNIIYDKIDKFRLYSIVIKKNTLPKHLIKFISSHSKETCTLILMFHSIVHDPKDSWEWSVKDFDALCHFVEHNNKISCLTIKKLLEKKG